MIDTNHVIGLFVMCPSPINAIDPLPQPISCATSIACPVQLFILLLLW
jgi:hypothetical protein